GAAGSAAKAAGKAGGAAAERVGQGASRAAEGARHGAERTAGQVAAMPGRAVRVVRLMNMRRFLRAAPVVVVAGAGLLIGRRVLKNR
ncbi:hypothetical protein, partial [Actinomadura yumaensis]